MVGISGVDNERCVHDARFEPFPETPVLASLLTSELFVGWLGFRGLSSGLNYRMQLEKGR